MPFWKAEYPLQFHCVEVPQVHTLSLSEVGEGPYLAEDTSNEGYPDLAGNPPVHTWDQPLTPAYPGTAGVRRTGLCGLKQIPCHLLASVSSSVIEAIEQMTH